MTLKFGPMRAGLLAATAAGIFGQAALAAPVPKSSSPPALPEQKKPFAVAIKGLQAQKGLSITVRQFGQVFGA